MDNGITVRAGLAAALAVVVLGAAACAAGVQPGAAGGPSQGSSSSSGASSAAGDSGSANPQSPPGTADSGANTSPAVATGALATSSPVTTAAEGSRTAPPIYEPPPTGSSGADRTSGGAASHIPAGLDGYLFRAVRITGRTLVSGTSLNIGFGNGAVSLNAGCNGAGGSPIFAGATLAVRQMAATEMACPDQRGGNSIMNQENWYGDWLTEGVGWKLDGTGLVLSGHGVTVTFARVGSADPLDHGTGPSGSAAISTAAISTAARTTAPASSGPDEPTAATPGTLVRPRPPSSATTMSPKTQRPGDSIPIEPTS